MMHHSTKYVFFGVNSYTIHIFGDFPDNLIYKSFINKLKVNNNTSLDNEPLPAPAPAPAPAPSPAPSTASINNIKEESKPKLKALSAYKLKELQTLASDNGIELKKNNKNKTRKQLYDEISLIL